METYLFIILAFVFGLLLGWALSSIRIRPLRQRIKSLEDKNSKEIIANEALKNESEFLHASAEKSTKQFEGKFLQQQEQIRNLENDIAILQKKYEETENLLESGQPVIHSLKLKLIEANNTIARYKGRLKD